MLKSINWFDLQSVDLVFKRHKISEQNVDIFFFKQRYVQKIIFTENSDHVETSQLI